MAADTLQVMPLRIVLNGETRQLAEPEPKNLLELLATLDLNPEQVAIEQNGTIIRRSEWQGSTVQDGDRFEIVQFVGGGSIAACARTRDSG